MSTDFYIRTDVLFEQGSFPLADLVNAIGDVEGVSFAYVGEEGEDFLISKNKNEIKNKTDTGSSLLIVSQDDYLWVNHRDGLVTSFERRGRSDVAKILNTIEEYAQISLWTDSFEYPRKTPLEQEQWWNAIGRYEEEDAMILKDPSCQLNGRVWWQLPLAYKAWQNDCR